MKFITADQLEQLTFSTFEAREEVLKFFADFDVNNWNFEKIWNGQTFLDRYNQLTGKYLRDSTTSAAIAQVMQWRTIHENKQKVQARAGSFDNSVFAATSPGGIKTKGNDCVDCFNDQSVPSHKKQAARHRGIPVLGGGFTSQLAAKTVKAKIQAQIDAGDVFNKLENNNVVKTADLKGNVYEQQGGGKDKTLEPLKDIGSKRAFTKFLVESTKGNTGMIPAHLEIIHETITGDKPEVMSDKELKAKVYDLVQDWRATQEA